MPRKVSLIKFTGLLDDAVKADDGGLLRQVRERLTQLTLDAFLHRSSDDLDLIAFECGKAHTLLVSKHRWERVPDLKTESWMLKVLSHFAELAARMTSAAPEQLNERDRSVRDQLLIALLNDNTGRPTNTELATRLRKPQDFVARLLGILRQGGLVESLRRGRFVENRLTEQGRAEAIAVANTDFTEDPSDRPAPPELWRGTLKRRRSDTNRFATVRYGGR